MKTDTDKYYHIVFKIDLNQLTLMKSYFLQKDHINSKILTKLVFLFLIIQTGMFSQWILVKEKFDISTSYQIMTYCTETMTC